MIDVMLTIYLVGVFLNLVLVVIEESKFTKPIWWLIFNEPRNKTTWSAVLDKFIFIVCSWVSYLIFGIMYYIEHWRE